MSSGYPPVPVMLNDGAQHRRFLARAINLLLGGKMNAGVDVTLTASATSTTLTDPRIGANSFIGFMPQTASAATALADLYVSGRTNGSATLTHASNSASDQTFRALIIG